MTIQERYEWACKDPDIGVLVPVLRKYGEQCQHITEFGVRDGVSTSAWLAAPFPQHAMSKKIVCYDIGRYPSVDEIANLASGAGIDFEFYHQNTAEAVIEPTDLLFIDTVHNANQLNCELSNHRQVSKIIIMHDTHTYGVDGEGPDTPGLWQAIIKFLDIEPRWRILEVRPESNGLTVLQRICPQ